MVQTRQQQLNAALTNTDTQDTITRGNDLAVVVPQRHPNSKDRRPAPIAIFSDYDTEEEDEVEKERAEAMELSRILGMNEIYCNRFKKMPKHLAAFLVSIQSSRTGPPSPKSRQVAHANISTSRMPGFDALLHLENHLGYMPASALNGRGEEYISRSHSQLWNATSVPISDNEHDDIMKAPKPDITYGYPSSSFSHIEMIRCCCLSSFAQVANSEPLLPFLIFEWKSSEGNSFLAELQAMRDGAAAVNALRQFCIETGTEHPREDETAVFCVRVGPETIDIYVSWHRNHPKEGESWEMDRLYQGFLGRADMVFEARSILLNILKWARQERLTRIKAALGRGFAKR